MIHDSTARKYRNENNCEYDQTLKGHLDTVCQHSSILDKVINYQGKWTLKEYLSSIQPNNNNPYQPLSDVINIVYHYLKPLLGETIASEAAIDLERFPVVLTANHHGVDYFSHSIQGSLLFSLAKQLKVQSFKAVPIFSCGHIPLNNPTYPRGLLLYRSFKNQIEALPKRISIFPDRLKRSLVSFAPPFDQPMIQRAEKRLSEMVRKDQLCSTLLETAMQILKTEYCRPSVLGLNSYSQQAVVLNNAIWKRLFSTRSKTPHLVYVEIEKVVTKLLELDLRNTESLVWCTLFDPEVREHLIDELNGVRSCWNREKLAKRLSMDLLNPAEKTALNGCGTNFFWGVDESGRQFPLYLKTDTQKNATLVGIDDRQRRWEFSFTPENILSLLLENRLQPSIFICYLVISMARSISCIGGYFQSEYLPLMLEGVVNVFQRIGGYHELASVLKEINPNFYLSGMSAVMTSIENDFLVPAGPVEIIAGNGLNEKDIDQILSLSVRDAHLASLYEILDDFTPWLLRTPELKAHLAQDSSAVLKGKVVIR
jgi:hypothetical protein